MDLATCRHLSDSDGTLHLSIVFVDFNAIFSYLKLPEKLLVKSHEIIMLTQLTQKMLGIQNF